MTLQEFEALAAQGFTRIALVREVLADLDTPLSTYLKLAGVPYSYLLESVTGGEKSGRYSMIGLQASSIIRITEQTIEVCENGTVTQHHQARNPLQWLSEYLAAIKAAPVPVLPRFTGGLVGYFGYDTVRYVEPRLGANPHPDELNVPDILLMVSDQLLVFDNVRGRLYIVVHAIPGTDHAWASANARIEELAGLLRSATLPADRPRSRCVVGEDDFVSGFGREEFEQAVRRCKQYIVNGDAMQIVLSQRLTAPFDGDPLDFYRALRGLNPSPYMFYLDLGGFQVVGSSPEILTQVENGKITLRPLAGTRPRGADAKADQVLEQELLADPKERAEHLMLIDLGRNDIGRVAQIGTVEVTEQFAVEYYSHVMHIVSNVHGQLAPSMSVMDALAATFPAGTLSGAPKIRALEILDELEVTKRGVYSGAVGYISFDGGMDTAIAIRTAVVKDGAVFVQAGAGIVADSDPATEWEETMAKSRALIRAVEAASKGLR
ncbi:MAG: anthranilate synthase component I [Gammaproteobacteria bacterium]|nr:anthranilate synthase component I [Gammaproteobacteria bacterium]